MRYPERIVTGQLIDDGHHRRARELRRELTEAEQILWQRLRANRLGGLHFRRQQVIRVFMSDLYCHAAGLVVEVDGGSHAYQVEYDQERDQILANCGVRVLRVGNEAVLTHLDEVLASIQAACREAIGSTHPPES